MQNIPFHSIAVYCGAHPGNNPGYREVAIELADFFVDHRIRLVNGGGNIGLMGIMADRVLARGGEAFGVIPHALKEKEVAHTGMTRLIEVGDMHARKQTMVRLSDAFIAIPGGFGTMDELFETLTWAQLHLHSKPIGILNAHGYFDALLDLVNHMVAEGFVKESARRLLRSASNIPGLFEKLCTPHTYDELKW